jgi:hypothetical protein
MRDIGVGTFGCGGADGLVGAAGAGIGLAGLLRVRAGTVFCGGVLVWMFGFVRKRKC